MYDIFKRAVSGDVLKRIREDSSDQYGDVTIKEASLRSGLVVAEIEGGAPVDVESLHLLAKAYHCYLDVRFIRIDDHGDRKPKRRRQAKLDYVVAQCRALRARFLTIRAFIGETGRAGGERCSDQQWPKFRLIAGHHATG